MKKTAFLIMILTVGSKAFGFLRDLILSYFYGTSNVSDVYIISQQIPMSIVEFVGLGLLTSFIPIYSKIKNSDKQRADEFTSNVLNFVIVLSTILIVLSLLFTKQLVNLFAMGFKNDNLKLAISFTKISIWSVYFISIGYVLRGYFQANGRFYLINATGYIQNIIVITTIFISSKMSPIVLSMGSLIAYSSELLIMLPMMFASKYKYSFKINVKDENLRELIILSIPMMIGISVGQINLIIDKTLASKIAMGGISALNYANRLNFFIQSIFVLSTTSVMYPLISNLVVKNDKLEFEKVIKQTIKMLTYFIVPISLGAFIFSKPIIELLFKRGEFNSNSVDMTALAMGYYSIGMIGIAFRDILSKAFYAIKDTKTPMVNAIFGVLINIVLNIILSRYMGVGGLALATSISSIIIAVFIFRSFLKKFKSFIWKDLIFDCVKILLVSIIAVVISKIIFLSLVKLSFSSNLALLLAIIAAIFIYIILSVIAKLDEMKSIMELLKSKRN